jgi:hypothetical protein
MCIVRFKIFTIGGSTPTGEYAGASIVARYSLNMEDIPADVEREFKSVALKQGFSLDEMCASDVRGCPPNDSQSP